MSRIPKDAQIIVHPEEIVSITEHLKKVLSTLPFPPRRKRIRKTLEDDYDDNSSTSNKKPRTDYSETQIHTIIAIFELYRCAGE